MKRCTTCGEQKPATREYFNADRRRADADFTAYRRGNVVRKASLNPTLENKVWPLFLRGDYDVAVFQAFKVVEVRVRQLGRYTEDDYGVPMMRKAFAPNKGPLAVRDQHEAEQEATAALFAGAIGLFKNPSSHRDIAWEADPAAEAVYLANTLLRILDLVESRLNS